MLGFLVTLYQRTSNNLRVCDMKVSGLSSWLGSQMTPLQSIPPWAIAVILCLLITVFTECASNVATATLFLPILASMVWRRVYTHTHIHIYGTYRHMLTFVFSVPVAVHKPEPSVCDDTLHAQRLFCLHVARGHTPQCHRLLLWLPKGFRYGETLHAMCLGQRTGGIHSHESITATYSFSCRLNQVW